MQATGRGSLPPRRTYPDGTYPDGTYPDGTYPDGTQAGTAQLSFKRPDHWHDAASESAVPLPSHWPGDENDLRVMD